ncbi:MAG: N-6 DNA methylase [Actinomyces sp.]|uniref:Eco57I restriction-modification methylase domain-containing protein n=1 Tax=Actinomyces sp. TaxID=29317 RepID=UPI0026DBEDA5|nr:N-6 DNA methylase [Actinomyces sp.]MDO4243244.1 N-6 DNA methylase [Actinomyces sp.]
MTTEMICDPQDTPGLRKARGAFFTPPDIASFIVDWAVRRPTDRILEPSTGDAEFLVHAVERLTSLGADRPVVFGSELHAWSAEEGRRRVASAGGVAEIEVGDFFGRAVTPVHDAVIGNPPYIRFQDFSGEQRSRARSAALRGGVALSGLASAWAAFTVVSALHLRAGGRLGFVLPAELLSANYAGAVRRFLFENFGSIELVLFDERVFAEAETEAVLLLASGYGEGPAPAALIRQVRSAAELQAVPPGVVWTPDDPAQKWAGATISASATSALLDATAAGQFQPLATWGETRLGMVTGANKFFAMTPDMVAEAGLAPEETLLLSPPGSAHLRGLELSCEALHELGGKGQRTRLFYPAEGALSEAAEAYLKIGIAAGVDQTYKSRARRIWWQVPLLKPADLFLTYMNADTVRLVTNSARAHHLNSVHGVYLHPVTALLGRELLPLAALNSYTMLSAELAGRAYGGGVLKMEPGEASRWLVPSPHTLESAREALRAILPQVSGTLRRSRLAEAVELVDEVLLVQALGIPRACVCAVREARDRLAGRREARSRGI